MADVLVVGAGPVGLTMAAELARHGVRPRIVDRLPAPSGYCKAIGVTPRTLEIWDTMGVVQPMIEAGLWLRGLRTILPGQGARDAISDLSDLPYGNLGIPQYATERILTDHLARFGVTVERGVTLTELHDDGRRVRAMLAHPDGRVEQTEYRYVVGCDGAHSAVRHAVNIGFPGDRFPMEFILGDVAIDWDVPRGIAVFSIVPREDTAPDLLVVIPLPDRNRYRISALAADDMGQGGDEDHGIMADRPGPSIEQLQSVVDRLLPGKPRLSELRWSSLFRISMRLADRYRVGNVFIAGDAAHIHPPTGGQGMNTGIQDAYNLAWKMALVVRGAADDRLLESYEAERRPVGADTVERTREASVSFGRAPGPDDRLRDTQILVNYRGSSIVEDGPDTRANIRAGDRAPDATGLRCDQIGHTLRLFDLLKGTAHVVIFYIGREVTDDRRVRLEAQAQEIHRRYGALVRVIAIGAGKFGAAGLVGMRTVIDAGGVFARAYEAEDDALLVIRPDGYIGYRGIMSDARSLNTFLGRTLIAS